MPSVGGVVSKRGPALSLIAVVVALLFAGLRKQVLKLVQLLLRRSQTGWPVDVWLDRRREEAIDPDLEVIDAHIHLWDPRFHPKGWPIPLREIQAYYATTSPLQISKDGVEDADKKFPAIVASMAGRSKRQLPGIQPYMGTELTFDICNRGCGMPGHNVVQTVYMECGWLDHAVEEALRPVAEAHMVEKVHAEFPKLCGGMVADANLLLAGVERTLKGLSEVPLVRGVRHVLACSGDPLIVGGDPARAKIGTARDPAFRRGFALLEKYGFSYDVWLFHEQFEDLADLAKAFPNTTIVLNATGTPLGIGSYTRADSFPVWEKGIKELAAASQNVYVKLGGLGMCITGFHFDDRPTPPSSAELAEAWGPYFRVAIEAFGVSRCMFVSNFPFDRVSCDYTVLWNAFKLIVRDYSGEDKRALFSGNARRVYRL